MKNMMKFCLFNQLIFSSYQQLFECGFSEHYLRIRSLYFTTKKYSELGIKLPENNFVEPLMLPEVARGSLIVIFVGNALGIILIIFEIPYFFYSRTKSH